MLELIFGGWFKSFRIFLEENCISTVPFVNGYMERKKKNFTDSKIICISGTTEIAFGWVAV